MSALRQLHVAVVAALRSRPELGAVHDAAPARPSYPHVVAEPPQLSDWGTKDLPGREARITLTLADRGERPHRLYTLVAGAEAALDVLPGDLGDGWRLVSLAYLRTRIAPDGPGRWTATIDHRARLLRTTQGDDHGG